MASHPPDPVRRIAELEHAVAELQGLVRAGGRHSHHVRDLTDADMSKVADGQSWIYQASTGTMVPGGAAETPPFSLATLALTTSHRYYPPTTTRVVRLVASLKTTGTTPTVLFLVKNGARVQGLTIPASTNVRGTGCSIAFTGPELDYMQIEVTAVGTGASGLTVQPRLG